MKHKMFHVMLNERTRVTEERYTDSFLYPPLHRRHPDVKSSKALLPATEFGLGIMREEDVCDGYGMGPSGE